jgi:hypothetical protein
MTVDQRRRLRAIQDAIDAARQAISESIAATRKHDDETNALTKPLRQVMDHLDQQYLINRRMYESSQRANLAALDAYRALTELLNDLESIH